MLRFLRSARSVNHSFQKRYPDLETRHVRIASTSYKHWYIGFIAATTVLVWYEKGNALSGLFARTGFFPERDWEKNPLKIPLGLVEKLEPVPYKPGCKEENAALAFLRNKAKRIQAEVMVIKTIKEYVLNSKLIDVGNVLRLHKDGYSMWFNLLPPPPTYQRTYLVIRPQSWEVTKLPVEPVTAICLDSITYPAAVAKSCIKFWETLFTVRRENANRGIRLIISDDIKDGSSKGDGEVDKEEADFFHRIRRANSPTQVAIALAKSEFLQTLSGEWGRRQPEPPPARGTIFAEGIVKMAGKKMNLILDLKVAIDPHKIEKTQILSLVVRYQEHLRPVTRKGYGNSHDKPHGSVLASKEEKS